MMTVITEESQKLLDRLMEQCFVWTECSECGEAFQDVPWRDEPLTCDDHPPGRPLFKGQLVSKGRRREY